MATAAKVHRFGSYSDVAGEYYDPTRHPTCANFREGSAVLLRTWLKKYLQAGNIVLETGAGASVVREIIDELGTQPVLVLCDKSPAMLNQPANGSAIRVVADVEELPIRSVGVDAIVASLGDPYNTLAFWKECRRILRPGGQIFFTTPSFEWACKFREETGGAPMAAQFDLVDGRSVFVPSLIFARAAQRQLVSSAGLTVQEEVHFDRDAISPAKRSGKLRSGHIVTGYRVISPSRYSS